MSELMNVKPRAVSNGAGFGVNDTCFMLLIAMPASKRPGVRLVRGSLLVGYVCADTMVGTTVVASSRTKPRFIRIGTHSGMGTWGVLAGARRLEEVADHLAP